MKLYIGNKNYSSWSLRAWLLLKVAGIEFEEIKLRLDFGEDSAFRRALNGVSPSGKVPVLVADDLAIWDTLAIAEFLAETYSEKLLWPSDRAARARARSVCAEMHAGFAALRQHCPMNIEAALPQVGPRLVATVPSVAADLQRIIGMWTDASKDHDGAFLFGDFSIADAFFAPVCSRIATYALPVPAHIDAYVRRVLALPPMVEWERDAREEHDFLANDEPYRRDV